MKRYLLKRQVLFLSFSLFTINLFPQQFVEQTGIVLPGVANSSVAWGDYNNDGYLDILLTGMSGSGPVSKIFKNNGNNTFTEQTGILLTGVREGSVAWGDYDRDGDLDILLTGFTGSGYEFVTKIYRNNGNNTFTEQTSIVLTGVLWSSVVWGDYDNDGDLDILLTGATGNNTPGEVSKIYQNNGDNSFTEQSNLTLPGIYGSSVAWGDYDNDGYLDILLTGSNISKIYRNNSDNSFTEQTGISLPGYINSSVDWGDYDNDGYLDILFGGGGHYIVYRNNGNNTFSAQKYNLIINFGLTSVAWGDYDNDGYLDILLTGGGTTRIDHNNGDNTFTEQTNISLTRVSNSSVAWGDYDNDGDLDILLTGLNSFNQPVSKIYRNETANPNTKPAAPSTLQSVIDNNKVTFTWEKSVDAETAQNGLNYNLYVYENGQSNYKLSPHAFKQTDLKNGKRLIAKKGNIQWSTAGYSIKNLPPGKTYSWSVQAIDAGMQGSNFSDEKSFTMPYYKPVLQANNISISNIQTTHVSATWANGGGVKRAVFIKATETGTADPVDNTTYNINDVTSGGWKCVYNGTANAVEITGLVANTGYLIQVCEYNGTTGSENYLRSSAYQNPIALNIIFTELSGTALTGVYNGTVAWGDYNNDGNLDILMTGLSSSGNGISKIYRNNGDNSFTEQTGISLPGALWSSAAWGDYNNDNNLDILLTSGFSKIYHNNGNNSFTEQANIKLAEVASPGSVAWSDYNNDGYLDILLTGFSNSGGWISKIYRNNGDNSFTEQTDITLTGVMGGSVAWCDYDNDGNMDILLTGYASSGKISKIYRNNSDNTFTEQTGISLTGVANSSIAWGDYNNDGYLDILLTGLSDSGPVSKIYRNNGNNSFVEQTGIVFTGVSNSSAAWGDYDNDGDLDILLTGATGKGWISKIYCNNGDNSFTEKRDIPLPGVFFGNGVWGDFDNDGDLDILLTGMNSSGQLISKIYRNESLNHNNKPSVPAGLISYWDKDHLFFKWNKSSDNTTPTRAINYNLRIGTSTGGNEVKSSEALPSGKLLLPHINNLINDTTIRLKLPLSKYFWSVQSVDKGGLASNFAAEQITPSDSIQAKDLQAFIRTSNSLLIRWKNGNGLRRVLFGRISDKSGIAKPISGKIYHAEPYFGQGDKIGTSGWYCMYNGKADSVLIYGVNQGYSYDIQVVEYIEINGLPRYFNTAGNGNPGIFSTSLFSEQTGLELTSNLLRSSIAWGDYDNDGYLDVLVTGDLTDAGIISKVFHNNGNNSFTEQTGIALTGVVNGSAAWGDYNNDGYLDILLTGSGDWSDLNLISKIYRNNGDNSFTEQTGINLVGVFFSSVAWGDYNNDGNLDILLTGSTRDLQNITPVSKIYRNNGDNTFTEQTGIALSGVNEGSAAWGDYDNDGNLDILLTGSGISKTGISKIYHNNGNNTFTEQNGIALMGVGYRSNGTWGDYDNDGYLDILLTGFFFWDGPVSKIYHNNGDNTFTEQTDIHLTGLQYGSSAWVDYDIDGDLDILMTGNIDGTWGTSKTKIYRNNGNNTFTEQTGIGLPDVSWSYGVWGDYDNDGDLDVFLAGSGTVFNIYRNNTIMRAGNNSANKKPSAPVKLSAIRQPGVLKLSWSPVKTDETLYKTLTYNVRVSTTPTGSNICSPQASTTNGFRRIATMGNAQLDTTFLIKYLSSGKYYWSVQAVDQGYAGGAWSAVDSFIVKNTQAFFKTDTVCLGLPTHFTDQSVAAEGIASWKWNFKDGTISSLQNPVHTFAASGIFNVKLVITSNSGVKDSLEKNIVIKPKPNTDFSASVACQGTETLLTNLTNTSGLSITSWSWDYGDGKGSTFQNPGSHGYLSAGDYQLTLTANADNKCSGTIIKTVSVGAYPVAAITANAPLSFCAGDSVILSVGSNPQYSYKWMLNNTGITNAVANNYTAKLSGNYSVDVTNTKGSCKTTSSQVVVTKLAMPATPVIVTQNYQAGQCPGENQIILSVDQPVIEYSYQWKRNGTPITNANGGSHIDILSAGDYSVTASLSGCRTESAIKTITYENAPPKPLIYIHGPNLWYLACSIANAVEYKYRWYYNGILIPEADKYIYVANKNLGNYYVTIENSKGCYNSSDVIKIPTGNISIEETDPFAGLKIYPNPSPGQFVVEIDNQAYGEFAISVLAQGGRQVLSTKFEKTTEHFSSQIDMNGQAKGIYIINFKTDKYLVTTKLVVE